MITEIAGREILEFVKRNVVTCIFVTVLCAFLIPKLFIRRKNLPPGPIGLPFVGYLPFLGKFPHEKLHRLGKSYNGVFSLRLGQRYVLVLTSLDAVKEAFSKTEFLGRPADILANLFKVDKSIATVNGKEWEDQRRFMLQLLRDLGFGKSKMEQHIQDEIHYFMKKMDEHNGKPFELKPLLTPSVSNNITSLVFGERYNYDDPRRVTMDTILVKFARIFTQAFLLMFFPWVVSILGALRLRGFKQLNEIINNVNAIVKKEMKEHENTVDPNNIRDYIDGYILRMRDEEAKNNKFSTFSDDMLYGNIRALFGAGSGTIRASLDWAFLILASHQDVQKKMQDEIEEVIGKEREPCWADRLKMPYTQATIMETLRWKTTVPVNLARYTLEDTTVQDYHIPKGTIVLANLWSMHNDTEYWDEPSKFLPERFLNKEKTTVIKSDAYMPFSIGRRSCPGEIFARIEVFLYITSIIQKYKVSIPEGQKPDFVGTTGFSNEPLFWEAQFTKRS